MRLKTNTLYVIDNGESVVYARTPDGEGCYFYDASEESQAYEDVESVRQVLRFTSMKDFEDFRYGSVVD